jgi:hypothetical protein
VTDLHCSEHRSEHRSEHPWPSSGAEGTLAVSEDAPVLPFEILGIQVVYRHARSSKPIQIFHTPGRQVRVRRVDSGLSSDNNNNVPSPLSVLPMGLLTRQPPCAHLRHDVSPSLDRVTCDTPGRSGTART